MFVLPVLIFQALVLPGVWREYDDLKHPECEPHAKLQIPAEEMHVVFWEVEEVEEPAAASPSSSWPDNPPPDNRVKSSPGDGEIGRDVLSGDSPGRSLVIPHNDTAIVCALSAPGDPTDATDPAAFDTSIGSTTLLDTFEGLSHDDVITFTLVDVTAEFDSGQMQSSSTPTTSRTPDSSSAEPPTAFVSPKVDENPCPGTTRVAGEAVQESGGCEGAQRGKKAVLSKIDPVFLPPFSPEPLTVNMEKHSTPASPETAQQASPVSSSDNLSLAVAQKLPQNIPSSFENRRWSYLLSKNPQFSTPNPVTRPQGPGGAPKAQLKVEDGSLPLKAAAMYNSFGIRSSVTHSPQNTAPSAPCPVTPNHQKVSQNSTTGCGTSPPSQMEILSSRRCGSHSSQIPPGLSHTEALRYKLLKKLKAKKKKLARLNEMLGYQGPDSTNLTSPSSVTSSTCGGSSLLELLSPATTASNRSPDSTSFLDLIATGQEGVTQGNNGVRDVSHVDACKPEPSIENFLDEFISQVASQRPTEMETEALSALDLFV